MKFTIPNQLTIIRIILTPVFVVLFIQDDSIYRLTASIVFFIAAFTDWYDGYYARRFQSVTRWGQFMDPLADKILVSSALVVFAYMKFVFWWMIFIIIGRDALITYLRSFALHIGKPIITSVAAKWKTFVQMGFVLSFLIYINIPGLPSVHLNDTSHPWLLWTTITLAVVVGLTLFSGIHYLLVNQSHLIELARRIGRIFSK
ncbi:MAG: CDP-diacylglycerol--glycerol-3-phosphate 3-phosphatidyltransferase [Calditrichaceae bacterium]|nr:CDP-diacylglycerol--glycerol-3-phosphate 3-phosphatidyltransferase [Calditrichaceae bacterium]